MSLIVSISNQKALHVYMLCFCKVSALKKHLDSQYLHEHLIVNDVNIISHTITSYQASLHERKSGCSRSLEKKLDSGFVSNILTEQH